MRRQGRAAPKDLPSPLPFPFSEARRSSRNPLSRIFKTLTLPPMQNIPFGSHSSSLSPRLFSQTETVTLGPTFKQSKPPALDSVSDSPLVVWFLREPYTSCRLLFWTRSWKPRSLFHTSPPESCVLRSCGLPGYRGNRRFQTAFARKTDSPQKGGWRLASVPSLCVSLLHM